MDFSLKPIIITGGPGSGKSTLIDALANDGFTCYSEVSRQIIAEQQAINGTLMPWLNLPDFAEECYNRMLPQHSQKINNITFCDRGLPDITAYLRVGNLPEKHTHLHSNQIYAPYAFICPPWKEIYKTDPQRPQTFDESVSIYKSLTYTYKEFGFQLIEVPFDTIDNRKKWIIEQVERNEHKGAKTQRDFKN